MGARAVTLTGRVTDAAGNTATKSIPLTVLSRASLGWSPGDSSIVGIKAQLAKYPKPAFMRTFSGPGKGLSSWSTGFLSVVPSTCAVHYSFKDWTLGGTSQQKFADWLTARPAARRGLLDIVTLDHEPEQGTDAGDPTPATFRAQWRELIDCVANHPRRSEIWLAPVYTEFYAKRNYTSWWTDFGQVASWPGIDAVGFDVYDLAYSSYRTPVERNEIPLRVARRADVRKPLVLAEWGVDRKLAIDPDGALAAKAMRDNLAYLRQQPDVPWVAWFYRDRWDLDATITDASGKTYTRTTERSAFVDLMATNP